jgi:hypothetical protein
MVKSAVKFIIITLMVCSSAWASKTKKDEKGISEKEFSVLIGQAISSKEFAAYKAARGFDFMGSTSIKSMAIQRITPEDPINKPRAIGAPIYEFKINVTYQFRDNSICTVYMAFLREKEKLKYDSGGSDGGCGE